MPSKWEEKDPKEQKEDRISVLARPKVVHQVIFCRPTVYWVDKIPKPQPRFTVPNLTPRQEELARFKKMYPGFLEDRPSAAMAVKRAALKATISPRVMELAQPRPFLESWELLCPRCPLVTKGALCAVPTERIIALAKPKNVPLPPKKPPRKIHRGPIAAVAKYEELSKPRIYTFESRNPWRVSKAALQYVPSPRIIEISRPVRVRPKVSA